MRLSLYRTVTALHVHAQTFNKIVYKSMRGAAMDGKSVRPTQTHYIFKPKYIFETLNCW